MPALSPKEVSLRLNSMPEWTRRARRIQRTFQFAKFLDGIEFVRQVARVAEKGNHHPDIDVRFNRVTLTLTTHDEGGITDKDFVLAQKCDAAFAKVGAR